MTERDNLLRASYPAVELRAAPEGGMPTMVGHFARFNEWTRIESAREGTFLERIAPGAFARTLKNNRDSIRVLFQHGRDPQVGDKPLGPLAEVREEDDGAYYEVPLLDTSYNRDLLPGLREGLYGASFRFSVPDDPNKDVWDMKPRRSPHNPDGIPERTIREARVFEFGPVTFPAYAGATAGVRSLSTDDLDAAVAPPEETEALPDAGPEPEEAHSDEGTRETVEPTIDQVPPPKESRTVEYVTREDKASRANELRASLARLAVEYPGVLPTEAQERWDADTAELDALERDIRAWDERQAVINRYANDERKTERAYETPNIIRTRTEADIYDVVGIRNESRTTEQYDQKLRDNAMRAVEIASLPPTTDVDEGRSHVARLLDTRDSENKELARRILVTGSPLYRRAFNKYVQGMPLSPEEQRGTALAVQVDGTGGYALPFAFDPTIIPIGSHSGWQNPYRQFARVETIVGTDTWQGLTSTAVVATRADEAAAATEQGPTFAQPSAMVTRVQGAVTYSIEMASDRPDIGAELAVLIAEAKDNEEEAAFSTGVGDALGSKVNPIGIFAAHGTSGAYTHVNLATAHTLAIGDLDTLEAAVPVRHRARAVWLMNERLLRTVQGLETTGGRLFNGGNYPAVGPVGFNATGNTGLRLLNKPVYITPSATYDVTVDDTPLMWLGAGDSYLVLDRAGINVEYIPHVFNDAAGSLPTGQRRLYFWYRNTAKPINTDGGRILMVLNA